MIALLAIGLLAQGAGDTSRAAASSTSADAPKVRASHRVDVIAPGEKIETVLDRMRAGRPPQPPADAQKNLPVRPPDGARPERPPEGPQQQQGPQRGPPGKGGPPGPPPGPPPHR